MSRAMDATTKEALEQRYEIHPAWDAVAAEIPIEAVMKVAQSPDQAWQITELINTAVLVTLEAEYERRHA